MAGFVGSRIELGVSVSKEKALLQELISVSRGYTTLE